MTELLNKIFFEDCLQGMDKIPDGSVDMILCDLPYGTTACKWDVIIPFAPLWRQYERVIKTNGAIVLTGREPFSSLLVCSNIEMYRHKWVWNKKQSGSHLNAKLMPLQIEEDIFVFSKKTPNYFPIMRKGKMRKRGGYKEGNRAMGKTTPGFSNYSDNYYPTNILEITNERIGKIHPTQKPVPLFEYLIRTYTNPGEIVVDNCFGSGTTGIACMNTGRNFIGFENDPEHYEKATNRIKNHIVKPTLFND